MDKIIGDVVCPKCESDICYWYDTDEVDFSFDRTGHIYIYCHCTKCKHNFKKYYNFNYTVTKEWND